VSSSTPAAIRLRNETAELARLSAFISEFCEREELPPDFDMALNLVAEEAFMNVVMHGFEQQGGNELSFTLTRDEQAVTLIVEDSAKAFNPLEAPEFDPATPIEQRRAGGLGIHLLRNLMSELKYDRVDGKNRLTMRKLIPS
jgi:anti-sigma regulatory factor (Ser/Thr protein kinase)